MSSLPAGAHDQFARSIRSHFPSYQARTLASTPDPMARRSINKFNPQLPVMEPHLFSIFMDVLLALHEAAQRRAPVESAFLSIVAQMDSRMTDAQRAALQVDIKGYQSRLMKKSIEEDAHRRREAEDYQTIVKEFATRDGEEMGLGDGYA